MKFEFHIAQRLKLREDENINKSSSPILNIAIYGISLAIIIMILSIVIICGFKKEIVTKIYSLDSDIKVLPFKKEKNITDLPVDITDLKAELSNLDFIKSIELISNRPMVLKTSNDFLGLSLRGYDPDYDISFIKSCLIDGKLPNFKDKDKNTEIIIPINIAKKLQLKTGDSVLAYFLDNNIKVRKLKITGIFRTDFEDFDKNICIGSQKLLREINNWNQNQGSYLAITTNDKNDIKGKANVIFNTISEESIKRQSAKSYEILNIDDSYANYFSWLNLLDTNIAIILILMSLVSGFTLISGLLIIVLERINTIGILKSLGASNASVRWIFIFLTQKIILKSIIIGNAIGLGLAFIQSKFHILQLDPESYYMGYVPIDVNWQYIIILNIGIIVLSLIALIAPSFVITSITPAKSLKFE